MKARKGWIEDGVGYIPLTQGQVAIVDASLLPVLEQNNWCAWWNPKTRSYYAKRAIMLEGRHHTVLMHRAILGLTDSRIQGDHRNHNTLDNRRENLRPATNAQNTYNQRRSLRNTSGVTGVYFYKITRKWRAQIKTNGKMRCLGYFQSKEEARSQYIQEAIRIRGEFAFVAS